MLLRRRALNFAARARPPFNPPRRPSAIACGFFRCEAMPDKRATGLPADIVEITSISRRRLWRVRPVVVQGV